MASVAAAAHYYLQLMFVHGTTSTQLLQLILLLISSLLLLLVVATSSQTRRRRRINNNELQLPLPPSPPGKLPVIGHLHQVGSLPHLSLRDLAAKHAGRDGLLLLHLGAVPTLVVSSPRAAEAVLRTHDHVLASRPWSPVADILFYGARSVGFAPYGDEWRMSRKVVAARLLSARKVEAFRHGRLEEVRVVLDKVRASAGDSAAVDMSEVVSAYANDVVCRAVLGESHRAGGRNRLLMELVDMNVALLGGFNLEDCFPRLTRMEVLRRLICAKAERVHRRWDQLFDELIQEHQLQGDQQDHQSSSNTTENLIQVLLAAEEEYGLTRDNVKALLIETFQASIESSYLVLDYAMAELMLNRHIMAKLQTEIRSTKPLLLESAGKQQDMVVMEEDLSKMPYLKAVIKETLRMHPPAPLLIPRLSTTDCDVNGYWIPAGIRIFVNAWALGRDPASWDRAEEFMPERFLQQEGSGSEAVAAPDMKGTDFAFLPFGAGRRICPGINFGIATIEIMLANLMYHFDWKIQNEGTEGGVVDMSEVFGMGLRRKEKLFLVPTIPVSS